MYKVHGGKVKLLKKVQATEAEKYKRQRQYTQIFTNQKQQKTKRQKWK